MGLVLNRFGQTRLGMVIALLSITYAGLHGAAKDDGIQSIGHRACAIPYSDRVGALLLSCLMIILFTGAVALATSRRLAIRYFICERWIIEGMIWATS